MIHRVIQCAAGLLLLFGISPLLAEERPPPAKDPPKPAEETASKPAAEKKPAVEKRAASSTSIPVYVPDPDAFEFYDRPSPRVRDRIFVLLAALDDLSWNRRNAAMKELCRLGDPVIPYVEKTLESAKDPDRVSRLKFVLVKCGWVSLRQLKILVPRYIRDIMDYSTNNLGTRNVTYPEQVEMTKYLVRHGRKVIPRIAACMEYKDPRCRRTAIKILGMIGQETGDTRVLSHLVDAVDEKDTIVRRDAVEWLRKLTGLDYKVHHQKKWKDWWKKEGPAFVIPGHGKK